MNAAGTDAERALRISAGSEGVDLRRDAVRALNHHTANESGPAPEDFGTQLAQAAHFSLFPLTRPKGRRWTRHNPWGLISISAGDQLDPITGEVLDAPLPGGGLPRLLLAYITTEARRVASRGDDPSRLDLTGSLRGLTTSLGLKSGSQNRAVLDQLHATLTARLMFARQEETVRGGKRGKWQHSVWLPQVAQSLSLWVPEQQPLDDFEPYITLSPEWLAMILDDSKVVPARLDVLAQLAGKPMAMDVLSWLANVTYALDQGRQQSRVFFWQDLYQEFTHDYERLVDFRKKWRAALVEALRYYPDAQVDPDHPHPTDQRQTVVKVTRSPLFIERKRQRSE